MVRSRPEYDQVSVGSLEFRRGTPTEREQRFQVPRDERPDSWQRAAEGVIPPRAGDTGFWAITRQAEVMSVSESADV
jgi:hypothetical protein